MPETLAKQQAAAQQALLEKLARGVPFVVGTNTNINKETREGHYYSFKSGLSVRTFFVGYDLTDNRKLIVEDMG
jgi:hypothetical protein